MGERVEKTGGLRPHLTTLEAWALALGTSVGWGSLIVTCNSYLTQAGPMGSVLGLAVGAVVMLLVGLNYHYLMNQYPDAGGPYAYLRESFGYDYGFLVSWFLILTYLAMFWANATSLPIFARYFVGDLFRVGRLYTLFGYDVYLGEALLSVAAIACAYLVCSRSRRLGPVLMAILVLCFVAGISACAYGAMSGHAESGMSFEPYFLPGGSPVVQVLRIACMSPWAFIGFEGIAHSVEEFAFPRRRAFAVLATSVLASTLMYALIIALSTSAYPAGYDSWLAYVSDLGNIQGLQGIPAFNAAGHYLGETGTMLVAASLFALVATSLIGNTVALSRLVFALARDEALPKRLARLNARKVPAAAMRAALVASLAVPFLGRTAVGWIVDVTTIGATLIYGFVSAAARMVARRNDDRLVAWTGAVATAAMVVLGLFLLVPNVFDQATMAPESYILFTAWAILGFLFFRGILRRDEGRRFGKSVVVWVALLSLVLVMSMVWMGGADQEATDMVIADIREFYAQGADVGDDVDEDAFIDAKLDEMHASQRRNTLLVTGLFALSLGIMVSNFSYQRGREEERERQLGEVRSVAFRDALTGVKSKHAYAEWEQRLNGSIASGEMGPFAVVVCDVNGLKQVNDTQGHKAGDEYIRSASQLICVTWAHSPVFRIGGDEFAVILQGEDFANREQILAGFDRQVEENIGAGKVVVSAGMSDYAAGADDAVHAVFERADAIMYERKQALKAKGATTRD